MGKLLDMISDFFDPRSDERNDELESTANENLEVRENDAVGESTAEVIELSVVINFVRELESYYTNDIFKLNSDYIGNVQMSDDEIAFVKKKIAEYQAAVDLIELVKKELLQLESKLRDIFGKSSYEFYDELVEEEKESTFKNAFHIVCKLMSINVIPKLDRIIQKRLEEYKKSWEITEDVPPNTSLRLLDRNRNLETYKVCYFEKKIQIPDMEKELLPEQLMAIDQIQINHLAFDNPASGKVWIRFSTVSRKQLEYLKKSTIFPINWDAENNGICYDIVDTSVLEAYIKSMIRLLIMQDDYIVISLVNPNSEMVQQLGSIVDVDEDNKKVIVIDRMAFLSNERTGTYKDNLQFELISRKGNMKSISFKSYYGFICNFIHY